MTPLAVRPLASVAVHEAGHLVILLALKFPVESASVVPDTDSAGRVVPASAPSGTVDGAPLSAAQEAAVYACAVMVSVAGAVAESLAGFTPSGCQDDDESVRVLADGVWGLLDVEPLAWRPEARAATEQYLRTHWQTVEHLAARLLAERTLSGARAAEIVGPLPAPDVRALLGAISWQARRAAARARTRMGVPA